MENEKKAKRILSALENCKVPVSWYCIDEDEIIKAIAKELRKIEKEEGNG